jgi:hypothetical protein
VATIYAAVERGSLPAVRLAEHGRIRIPTSALVVAGTRASRHRSGGSRGRRRRARRGRVVIQTRERQAAHELLTGATVALVDPADLAAADAAIAAALKDRGQLAGPATPFGQHIGGANDQGFRLICDFIEKHPHSTPGFNFVVAISYAAGKAAK